MKNIEYAVSAVCVSVRGYLSEERHKPNLFCPFAVAALEYLSCMVGNGGLDSNTLNNLRKLQELGVVLNDYFDVGHLNSFKYSLAFERIVLPDSKFDETAWNILSNFQTRLETIETSRPVPGTGQPYDGFVEYRDKSNLLHLLGSLALQNRDVGIMGLDIAEIEKMSPELASLYFNVMALQVQDDRIGAEGDILHRRPSFVTGLLDVCNIDTYVINRRKIDEELLERFNLYREKARGANPEFNYPIGLCVSMAPLLVKVSRASKNLPFKPPFLSARDYQQR